MEICSFPVFNYTTHWVVGFLCHVNGLESVECFTVNDQLRREWYSRADVLSNIIPLLFGREVCFMVPHSLKKDSGNYPVRCIKAHHSSYLFSNIRAFDFFNRKYNLYHSIYSLEGMPMFSFSPLKRGEEQKAFFRDYDKYVRSVDFVMDFDGDKTQPVPVRIEEAKKQTLRVCAILSNWEIPYCVIFSGSKGFHVEVRGFPTTEKWRLQTSAFEEVAMRIVLLANGEKYDPDKTPKGSDLQEYLLKRYSFDSSIYNVTRIWKVPYSYDVSTDCIAMPLSGEELINFNLENYTVDKMLQKNHWNVGLKKRKGNIENFWKLAEKLGVQNVV